MTKRITDPRSVDAPTDEIERKHQEAVRAIRENPEALAALESLRVASTSRAAMPLPPSAVEEARELEVQLGEQKKRVTAPNVVGSAPIGLVAEALRVKPEGVVISAAVLEPDVAMESEPDVVSERVVALPAGRVGVTTKPVAPIQAEDINATTASPLVTTASETIPKTPPRYGLWVVALAIVVIGVGLVIRSSVEPSPAASRSAAPSASHPHAASASPPSLTTTVASAPPSDIAPELSSAASSAPSSPPSNVSVPLPPVSVQVPPAPTSASPKSSAPPPSVTPSTTSTSSTSTSSTGGFSAWTNN